MNHFPPGARVFPLLPGTKIPFPQSRGHLDAKPAEESGIEEGKNWGLALDGQFLLVDFDREDSEKWKDRLPPTWRVKTRRGEHWLYRIPEGWRGSIPGKFPSGELKVRGYAVGPGSVVDGHEYVLLDKRTPVEAPTWLLDYRGVPGTQDDRTPGRDRDIISDGEGRDGFLTALAGTGRSWGLSQTGLERLLKGVLLGGVVEQGSDPFDASDVKRIAKSIGSKAAGRAGYGLMIDPKLTSDSEIELVRAPQEWWIHSFIPKGELVMLYGDGGIGKSTFVSWLVKEVVAKGGRVLYVGVEEPFYRFVWRCVLSGMRKRGQIYALEDASRLKIPRDLGKLWELVAECKADFVYFDSIKTHLEASEGQNAAERDRACLGPLAESAMANQVTVLGNFHVNKSGEYSGSTELKNVCRYMLQAERKVKGPLTIHVKKTNLKDPGYKLTFDGVEIDMVDPATGLPQIDVLETGERVTDKIMVAVRGENRELDAEDFDERAIEVDDVQPDPMTIRRAKLYQAVKESPQASKTHLAKELGVSRKTIYKWLNGADE